MLPQGRKDQISNISEVFEWADNSDRYTQIIWFNNYLKINKKFWTETGCNFTDYFGRSWMKIIPVVYLIWVHFWNVSVVHKHVAFDRTFPINLSKSVSGISIKN